MKKDQDLLVLVTFSWLRLLLYMNFICYSNILYNVTINNINNNIAIVLDKC